MFSREPAVVFSALGEIVKAVIPVLIIGEAVHWTDKMTAAVMFLVSVAVTSLSTIFTRSQSISTTMADRQIEIAKASSIDRPTEEIVQEAAK